MNLHIYLITSATLLFAKGFAQSSGPVHNISVKGKVIDYHSGGPLKNFELEIKNTAFKSVTNDLGGFMFTFPDTLKGKQIIISSSPNERTFLDSTSSFVPDQKIVADVLTDKEIMLYRYPIETLPSVNIEKTNLSRVTIEIDHYNIIRYEYSKTK
jgi:hypothetical protein